MPEAIQLAKCSNWTPFNQIETITVIRITGHTLVIPPISLQNGHQRGPFSQGVIKEEKIAETWCKKNPDLLNIY